MIREPGPRLGRGLAALLGDSHDTARLGTPETTAIALLTANPFQPRGSIREEDLTELAASIRAQGVLQPILIRPHPSEHGRFQIIAGERRWRAARLAGLSEIPSFVRDMSDADASTAALVENLQRKDLNPIEEAEGYRRLLLDFKLSHEVLGAAIGKSRSHVANLIRLLNLPEPVIEHVRSGVLSAGHARAALACDDPAAAADLMITRGLNVRQAEALSGPNRPTPAEQAKPDATRQTGSADLRAVERDLSEQLGLHVAISFNGRGGTISLRYQNLDQLDHVVGKLGRL